jgi:hypothetical protein
MFVDACMCSMCVAWLWLQMVFESNHRHREALAQVELGSLIRL